MVIWVRDVQPCSGRKIQAWSYRTKVVNAVAQPSSADQIFTMHSNNTQHDNTETMFKINAVKLSNFN